MGQVGRLGPKVGGRVALRAAFMKWTGWTRQLKPRHTCKYLRPTLPPSPPQFRGSAQNSACRGKLWSLGISDSTRLRRILLFGHVPRLTVPASLFLSVSCATRDSYFPWLDWCRPTSRPRITWVHQICSDTDLLAPDNYLLAQEWPSFMANCHSGRWAMQAMMTTTPMMMMRHAFVCECTLQIVLTTLVQNLQMCTHVHGHDTLFDAELCLAHVAHMLNISCTDKVNVSISLKLLITSRLPIYTWVFLPYYCASQFLF